MSVARRGGLLSTNQSSRGGVRRDEMYVVEWKFRVPISGPGKLDSVFVLPSAEPSVKSAQPRTHPGFVIGGCPEQWPENQQPLLADTARATPDFESARLNSFHNFRFTLKGFTSNKSHRSLKPSMVGTGDEYG